MIGRLGKRVEELKAFDPATVESRFESPEVTVLQVAVDETLAAAFGHGTPDYYRYRSAAKLDHGPVTMSTGFERRPRREDMPDVFQGYIRDGRDQSVALLEQAIRSLEEEMPAGTTDGGPAVDYSQNRKVFVVHGRDDGPREAVARFIERLGFQPVILHEQANQGRTVIEKVEAHSGVGFAIVLLTPDDEGALQGEVLQPRARQNVLLELGYFIGKLDRSRVCTLKVGDIEIPSDWRGVVDEAFDAGGGWKQTLARELQAAGYDVDWNKVMRP